MTETTKITASHWGPGLATIRDGKVVDVAGHPDDPAPSLLNSNIAGSLNGAARVLRPAIRKSWLDGEPDAVPRGRDVFVEVPWDEALDLVAAEITRIRDAHGNKAIFAGSYGWASAGRFHHAQSQLKRFLNSVGGFTRSEGNYSYNAAMGLLPYIVGPFRDHVAQATRWPVIAANSDLVVLFGGLPMRNTQLSDGGVTRHRMPQNLELCVESGVEFVSVSPLRSDTDDTARAQWMPIQPGTDTALMLALAHVLCAEGLQDQGFLDRYTVGFDRVLAYLDGSLDGQPKSPSWAEPITGIPARDITRLARKMAASRTMISVTASLQRADYGEQPLWAAVTLASLLGQIGLPGGGYTIGYGVNANIGNIERLFRWAALPQGTNPVGESIPVAMISDMMLRPGESYTYHGQQRRFPHARLVWWAGGNPFHHHQDLNRLHRAFQAPETVIVNEVSWTATARHADIVLPVAAPQERIDFGAGKSDDALVPMATLVPPPGAARVEYDIYRDLAARLGALERFTEGLTTEAWLERLWDETRDIGARAGVSLPDWDTFMSRGEPVHVPDPAPDQVFLSDFRADPAANPLPTPSGRIELYCDAIAAMDLPDCPGHAAWRAPRDQVAGLGSLALLSGQPATRLHSQHDNGAWSISAKINGREPVLIHPDDAEARGIRSGDVVELSNARGACLAGARVTAEIRPGCVFLWTGAWWDPDFTDPRHRDRHGNPNALTHDLRTSELTQSTAAHSARVDLRRVDGPVPDVTVHQPPGFGTRGLVS